MISDRQTRLHQLSRIKIEETLDFATQITRRVEDRMFGLRRILDKN